MILTCPTCGTQYVVKDGAIPPGGTAGALRVVQA